jgi:hypothetical protein
VGQGVLDETDIAIHIGRMHCLNEELDTNVNQLQIERNEERRTFCGNVILRFRPICCPRRHDEGLGRRVSNPKALVLETRKSRGPTTPEPAESRRLADQPNVDRGCTGISNGQTNDSTKDQPGTQLMALDKGQKHPISIRPCYPAALKTKRVISAAAFSLVRHARARLWTGACIE